MTIYRNLTCLLLFSFLLPLSNNAQQARFTFREVSNDAIIGRFKDIIQDENGILWLTSDNGIIRYNSKEAHYYPQAFESNYTKSFIKVDEHKMLSIHDKGVGQINYANDSKMYTSNALGIDSLLHFPKTIYKSAQGTYWIGEDSTLVRYKNGSFKRYEMGFNWHSISYVRTYSMVEDGFGDLWAFSYYGKIYALNTDADRFEEVTTNTSFRGISWARRKDLNTIWIGCSSGIYELKLKGNRTVGRIQKIADIPNVSTFRFIDEGQLLVGTWSDGLYFLQTNKEGSHVSKLDKVDFQDVLQILPDRDRGYWILSSERLGLLQRSPFEIVKIDPSYNMIRSVSEIERGKMLVSNGITISMLEREGDEWITGYTYNTKNLHFYMAYSFDDIIAAGDNYGQVFFIYPETGEFEKVEGIDQGGEVGWLYEDLEQRLWVCGNLKVGLYRIDRDKNVKTFADTGLREIQTLKAGPDGNIFAAGRNIQHLLYQYDYGTDTFTGIEFENSESVGQGFVTEDILVTTDTLFLASSHGFYYTLRNPEKPWELHRMDIPSFGNSNYLKAIQRTPDGAFWLAGETGLIRYFKGEAQHFDQINGLPTRAIRFRGLEVDDYGNLWVATEKGLTLLPPDTRLPQKTALPQIEVNEIGITSKKTNRSSAPVRFSHGSNLEFSYLSHVFPQEYVFYQVRIPELDTNWSNLKKESQMRFMNFHHGQYTLQVRAISKGHQFSEVNEMSFLIERPWYNSSWFYVVLLISLSMFTGMTWKLYQKHLDSYALKVKRQLNMLNQAAIEKKNQVVTEKQQLIDQLNKKVEKEKSHFETEKALLSTELKYRELNNNKIKGELELKKKQLTSQVLKNIQKEQSLTKLVKDLNTILKNVPEDLQEKIGKLLRNVNQNTSLEKDWDSFRLSFEEIHTGFNEKLKANFPELTSQDLRHCALIRANLSTQETATLLGISPESVKTSRYRLKKKLNLTQDQGLLDFLISI